MKVAQNIYYIHMISILVYQLLQSLISFHSADKKCRSRSAGFRFVSKDDNCFEKDLQTMYYSSLMADSNRLRVKWLIFKLIPHLSATSKTNLDHPDVIPESFCY